MSRLLVISGLLVFLVAASGCGEQEDAKPSPEQAVKAAKIADEIAQSPDDFDAVLERHELTEKAFQELMFEIAEDPELTRVYEENRKVADPR